MALGRSGHPRRTRRASGLQAVADRSEGDCASEVRVRGAGQRQWSDRLLAPSTPRALPGRGCTQALSAFLLREEADRISENERSRSGTGARRSMAALARTVRSPRSAHVVVAIACCLLALAMPAHSEGSWVLWANQIQGAPDWAWEIRDTFGVRAIRVCQGP